MKFTISKKLIVFEVPPILNTTKSDNGKDPSLDIKDLGLGDDGAFLNMFMHNFSFFF